MSIVLNVSIRMYLPDVVGAPDDVVEKLTEVSNNISGGKLYFWYEKLRFPDNISPPKLYNGLNL